MSIITRGLGGRLITQGYGGFLEAYIITITRDYWRQQIIDDVIAALGEIKVVNGYQTNAGASITRKFTPARLVSRFPHLSVCDGSEALELAVDSLVDSVFFINVFGVVESRWDPHKEMNKVIGDIKLALLTDPERGDTAHTTMVTDITADESLLVSENRSFFKVAVRVEYSHRIDRP